MPPKHTHASPLDVFMHLLMIITLYLSAAAFLTLLFQLINSFVPDPLDWYVPGGAIRWAIATLIVIFPVFIWASWFLNRSIAASPDKADLRIRKWLMYFTLFAAAGIIMGDLVTLIFNFLEGDLTTRFLLKVCAVLVVAAAVFGYYLYDLRRKPRTFAGGATVFAWSVAIVVLATVIVGFIAVGSPFRQRLARFDDRRVNDLQTIQFSLVNYWQQKEELPAALSALEDDISGFRVPTDPATGQPYEYFRTGDLSFELCATFELASEKGRGDAARIPVPVDRFGVEQVSWEHDAGRVCFSRTIDPELYPPNEPRKI